MKNSIITILIITGFFHHSFAQDTGIKTVSSDILARSKADTSKFNPNKKEDWIIYNSYMELTGKDSTLFEVTICHDRNIKWEQYQYFGKITSKKMLPVQTQEIKYLLLADVYSLKIETDGKCYISLSGGQLPPRDPIILPIRIVYKRI